MSEIRAMCNFVWFTNFKDFHSKTAREFMIVHCTQEMVYLMFLINHQQFSIIFQLGKLNCRFELHSLVIIYALMNDNE